jgi:hypothetical protein
VGWAILSPLSKLSGWAPGPVGDMSNGARGWILWISLGIMCTDSLISLLPVVFEYLMDALQPQRRNYTTIGEHGSHETETEDRLVPTSWVLYGLLVSVVVGTVLVWVVTIRFSYESKDFYASRSVSLSQPIFVCRCSSEIS